MRILSVAVLAGAALCGAASGQGVPVTLQWFETSWRTMEDRTADAFVAGYGRVWTPPPTKAEGGASSVGYNLFDRFDLGTPASPTRYGTLADLQAVIAEQDKACIGTFIDLILNHNSFSDRNTPGFEAAGGYPGFIFSRAGDPLGDFHPSGISCDSDPLNCRISGLIDIAQEKNHALIRHPTTPGDPRNIAAGTTYNRPDPANARYYPDPTLPSNSLGIHPFNLADPMAGVPTVENATGLLLRWTRWLLEVVKIDGFRIDAARHVPGWFFSQYYDAHVWGRGQKDIAGGATTPESFVEVYDGNWSALNSYICKNGLGANCGTSGGFVGHRDALDFPLYFALASELNGSGYGSWTNVVSASVDGVDGSASDGTLGVQFVSGHDAGLPPPALDNVAYAYILTRPGSPIVYFQAEEFGNVTFPIRGRGDALGGTYGTQITTLIRIHNAYARGTYVERWRDANVLAYERSNACLVGLSNRMDGGYDQRTVQTAFAPGTRLTELTGNASDTVVDPYADIADVITVTADGQATLRIPRNRSAAGVQHNRGYVIYGPFSPAGTLSLTNVSETLPPDPDLEPNGVRRLTPIRVIRADTFDVRLETTPADPLDAGYDDLARLRVDAGIDLNGNGAIDVLDPAALDFGYENFATVNLPLKTAMAQGGTLGTYAQVVDATKLADGRHYLSVVAYRSRPAGTPPIFRMWREVFLLDRAPPAMELISPPDGSTVTGPTCQVIVRSPDRTARRVHIFMDYPPGTDLAALAEGGQGSASQLDRDLFLRTFTGVAGNNHRIDVLAYEATRNQPGVTTFHINPSIGNFDGDTDVDQEDFGRFQACLTGPSVPQADPACNNALLTPDAFVDHRDFEIFEKCMSGAGTPARADCAITD